MTTILHVEDDELLAEAVKETFQALGFRGTYEAAHTIAQARALVRSGERAQMPDLVIADMHLPDGTGIDLVQLVRSDPSTSHIPVVILSGDPDTATVNRAYALGANAYVSKGTSQRSIGAILGNLYAHWLKDAILPHPGRASRTLLVLREAISLRSRKSALYLRVAEKLGRPSGDFWMDLALREGNLANLLSFLAAELGPRELPPELLEAAETAQRAESQAVTELESRRARSDDAILYLRKLVANLHMEVAAQVIGHLFPAVPTAMAEMREVAATTIDEVASWIDAHSTDQDLRARIAPLRADVARLRIAGDRRAILELAALAIGKQQERDEANGAARGNVDGHRRR